jgi:peptide/nickel transport system permease protein
MPAVLRRIALLPALLACVLTLTFGLIQLAPGDAAAVLVSPGASAEEVARLRQTFALDRPPHEQYARYLGSLLRGDLGYSVSRGASVAEVLGDALPTSVLLGSLSLFATFMLGISLGAWQATRRGTRRDAVLTVSGTIVGAMPAFWLALLLIVIFTSGAATWGWPGWLRLPPFGVRDPALAALGVDSLVDRVRHLALPLIVLTLIGAAGVARYARAAVATVLDADAVRSARAKGASPTRVLWRHALRTTLAPLVVLLALAFPGIVAGSVFVEQLFALPGMGRTMLLAITSRDVPLVLGCTALFAAVVAVSNLLGDLALSALDPRQRDGLSR